jgi:hypothetical protein
VKGLEAYTGHILREFQIASPDLVTPAVRTFIADKFIRGYSVNAAVRDLRSELHQQMIANAAKQQIDNTESLVK